MADYTSDVELVLRTSLGQFTEGLNEATRKLTGALESMRGSAQKEVSEIDAAFATLGVTRTRLESLLAW